MGNPIKSIFGSYADRLQLMIDSSLDKFEPTWFQQYFDWGTPQFNLTYTTAIGRNRIEAAATFIDRNSPAPLRSRPGLEKLAGEMPTMAEKFRMDDEDFRNYYLLKNLNGISDDSRRTQMLDMIFNDTLKVGNSVMKKLDYVCLEGISTGKVTINSTNNPDGLIMADIDLLMPSSNKVNASANWSSSPTTAKPITDIQGIVDAAAAKGISFSKILMTRAKVMHLLATDSVKDTVNGALGVVKGNSLPTLEKVNGVLVSLLLPPIEIIEKKIGIEKDGVITTYEPFNTNNVVFVPASGKLGVIHQGIIMEDLERVPGVSYAKFNNALISKYSQNDPLSEWTKAEMIAFPGFEAVDSTYILSTTVAF